MKRIFYLIISVFILFSCSNKAERYFRQAELLEAEDKLDEAISYLDMAIVEDSMYLPAYINRAVDKSILGNYSEAIADYTKAIEIDSTFILAFLNRGKNKCRQNYYLSAIEDYNTALRLKEYDDKLYQGAYISIHLDESFFGNNNERIPIPWNEPSIPEILYERAIAYYYIDSLQLALNDFNVCIRIGNKAETSAETSFYWVGDCYYWRGFILLGSEKEQACKDFQRAAFLGVTEAQEALKNNCY